MTEQYIDSVKRTSRRRGEHSTECKCPNPVFFRPEHYRPLSGEIGHAYRRLVKKDKQSGHSFLRIRLSRNPFFVHMRRHVGRERGFRLERKNLLDALVVLLISCVDRTTLIVTMNVTRLATELSPKDESGQVIQKTAVTPSRVCRLIQELINHGLLDVPDGVQWDVYNRNYFPKHVVLTETFWKLTGINLDKLYAEQAERVRAEAEGVLHPGEEISVKAARRRWYDKMRRATLIRRREEAIKQKRYKKLLPLKMDDRAHAMASILYRTMPREELYNLSPAAFEKLVWQKLYQLDLGLERPPPTSQEIH